MGHEVTIGGERLGSGKRMKAYLHNYERSTHDLSYVWRSTMAAGTLVPFLTEVALPGDTFDIDLNCTVLTHPTIGPLFGTYKVELDVFQIPIRLYNAKLHMNMLGIGLDMSKVHLPQLEVTALPIDMTKPIDNQQINPSSLLSYLNIRGLGQSDAGDTFAIARYFNAVPMLAYWDIYKNYYANKQEEIGAFIHNDVNAAPFTLEFATLQDTLPDPSPQNIPLVVGTPLEAQLTPDSILNLGQLAGVLDTFQPSNLLIHVTYPEGIEVIELASDLFQNWQLQTEEPEVVASNPTDRALNVTSWILAEYLATPIDEPDQQPKVVTFPLTNIDDMRFAILQSDPTINAPFIITKTSDAPYGSVLDFKEAGEPPVPVKTAITSTQEGLALKTYNSDLFNNWISTEWIDGADGISEITKISTVGDSFTIDELNLKQKIYNMLNRIAISGGTYDDWLDAVYTHERDRSAENPMYLGGLIRNLVFQEVVSNAETSDQPLGTLAGRGVMGNKNKGGKIIAKIDEPSYLMGIVSITPHIDYSQGNKWDTNLRTLNDLHKPALDEIGFQDLITDQMAWFDTIVDGATKLPEFKSAGKQPAWVNYMTNVNQVRGNFADQTQQMFMTLNRRYDVAFDGFNVPSIKDVTTYIDPSKFNHIFADTRLDAQNFWTQIGVNIEARRKMSAKVIPNL